MTAESTDPVRRRSSDRQSCDRFGFGSRFSSLLSARSSRNRQKRHLLWSSFSAWLPDPLAPLAVGGCVGGRVTSRFPGAKVREAGSDSAPLACEALLLEAARKLLQSCETGMSMARIIVHCC